MPYTVTSIDKPNDTYTFTYDGVKWTGTVPAGAISMAVYLWEEVVEEELKKLPVQMDTVPPDSMPLIQRSI